MCKINETLSKQLLAFAREHARRQLEAVRASPYAAGLDDEAVRRRADLQRWLKSGQEVSFRASRNEPWQRGIYLDMAGPKMALRVLVREGRSEKIVPVDPGTYQVATRLERVQLRLEAQLKTLERELARQKRVLARLRADIQAERTRVSALVPPEQEARA